MPSQRSRPRAGLSRDRILEAACSIVRSDGVEALSLRRVADQLGVTPMALYNYFDSKQEILGGVVDRVVEQAGAADHDLHRDDWRLWISETFLRTYRSLRGRHDLVGLIGTLEELTPATRRFAAAVLDVLRRAGFADRDAVQLFSTLIRYAMGAAVLPLVRVSASGQPTLAEEDGVRHGISTIIDGFAVSSVIDARLRSLRDAS